MPFSAEDHLITHLGCMDGSACSLVFQYCGGRPENIHYSLPLHEKVDELALKVRKKHPEGRLILADISISMDAAKQLDGKDVVICDHHKSAIPLSSFGWANIDKENSQCGSLVFFRWVQKTLGSAPFDLLPLLTIVDDRDRWINQDPRSAEISELFSVIGQDMFVNRFLIDHRVKLNQQEEFLVRCERARKEDYLNKITNRVFVRKFNEVNVGIVECDKRYTSEAGHKICEDLNLDACFLVNTYAVSIRTPDQSPVDAAAFATRYGGGGHQHAAGFPIKELFAGKTLAEVVADELTIPTNDSCLSRSRQHCG